MGSFFLFRKGPVQWLWRKVKKKSSENTNSNTILGRFSITPSTVFMKMLKYLCLIQHFWPNLIADRYTSPKSNICRVFLINAIFSFDVYVICIGMRNVNVNLLSMPSRCHFVIWATLSALLYFQTIWSWFKGFWAALSNCRIFHWNADCFSFTKFQFSFIHADKENTRRFTSKIYFMAEISPKNKIGCEWWRVKSVANVDKCNA